MGRRLQQVLFSICFSLTRSTSLSSLPRWTQTPFLNVPRVRLSFHEALSSVEAAVEVAKGVNLKNSVAVTLLFYRYLIFFAVIWKKKNQFFFSEDVILK